MAYQPPKDDGGSLAGHLAKWWKPRPLPNGFTIVKESFHAVPAPQRPREADAKAQETVSYDKTPEAITWVETDDGKRLEVGQPSGLFVMTKLGDKDTPGTDAGWIYGTISTNGTVTSAGRVATCMGCHEEAGEDRLFGLQPTKQLAPSPVPPDGDPW